MTARGLFQPTDTHAVVKWHTDPRYRRDEAEYTRKGDKAAQRLADKLNADAEKRGESAAYVVRPISALL